MKPAGPGRCPMCGPGGVTSLVFPVRDRFDASVPYRIARCRTCRVAFTTPVRDSYPEDYEPFQFHDPAPRTSGTRAAIVRTFYQGRGSWASRLLLFLPWLVFRARDKMKVRARELYARPFRRRGRLLDIGCGGGSSLKSWVNQQDECVAVETDPAAAAVARRRLGVEVRAGSLEDQGFAPASFDVITLSHVLEHVPDPRKTLARCADLLRPGGEILIWVPNFESPFRGFFGAGWFPYEVPRHRWHFRPGDVRTLLLEAGLTPVEMAHDANEVTFRRSARAMPPGRAALLRRRTVRILCVLAGLFARWTDVFRIRAVKKGPTPKDTSPAP